MTRAVKFLLLGQLMRSWNLHPMAVPWVLFALYCIVMRYFLGRKVKGFRPIATALLAAMLGLYLYRMITIFPDRPPMSYTRNNLLRKLVKLLKDLAEQQQSML